AATLNSHDGVKDAAAVKTHLFADGGNGVVSQGWGTISLQPKVDEPKSATSAMTYAKLEDLPSYARKPGRLPRRSNT
ncbi:MAG: hypothetical protein QF473_35460, partial [Planctomycetota bacterium]|nr:hypothetical protein [Planctomycetota bacterium]